MACRFPQRRGLPRWLVAATLFALLAGCGEKPLVAPEEAKITRDTKRFLRLSVAPAQGGEADQDQGRPG